MGEQRRLVPTSSLGASKEEPHGGTSTGASIQGLVHQARKPEQPPERRVDPVEWCWQRAASRIWN